MASSSEEEEVMVGTESGKVLVVNASGRITRVIQTGVSDRLNALVHVNAFSIVVGTDKGCIFLLDPSSGSIKSTWKASNPPKSSVSCISVDARRNWFAALIVSGGKVSLVSGSTRSLVRVFESRQLPSEVNRCEFFNLASSGLSILVGGRSVPLTVVPLDLSTLGTRRRSEADSAAGLERLCKSRGGELLSVTFPSGQVEILAGSSLALVSKIEVV
jgi:hypothetical protein